MSDSAKLTNEARRMLQYFWLEKGDLTRWCGWEEALPAISKELPDLLHAYQMVKFYEQALTRIVRNLETGDEL